MFRFTPAVYGFNLTPPVPTPISLAAAAKLSEVMKMGMPAVELKTVSFLASGHAQHSTSFDPHP